ncbi:glycosyltransferase family 52, partial [Glaesserella parasuis]
NNKYDYYYNILKKFCKKYSFFYVNPVGNKLIYIKMLLFLRMKSFFLIKINKVFIASIDGINIHLLLSSLDMKKIEIYTYDDGVANIVKDSFLYKRIHRKIDILGHLVGNKYSMDLLKENSICHYSVYRQSNIIDNVIYLDLIDPKSLGLNKKNNVEANISILLGQPIYELANDFIDKEYMNKYICNSVIKKFNIDYYFPHPRETYRIDKVDYINTELIFEDFFSKNYNPDINYTVYTFFSGSVLPFIKISNVKIVSVKPINCPNEFLSSYNKFLDMGIDIVEI